MQALLTFRTHLGTHRPANHHRVKPAGYRPGQLRSRLFERHRIQSPEPRKPLYCRSDQLSDRRPPKTAGLASSFITLGGRAECPSNL